MSDCAVDGCTKPARKRGWCSTHYTRWFRHGDPEALVVGRVQCGTYSGYIAHIRKREPKCAACSDAARAYRAGEAPIPPEPVEVEIRWVRRGGVLVAVEVRERA